MVNRPLRNRNPKKEGGMKERKGEHSQEKGLETQTKGDENI